MKTPVLKTLLAPALTAACLLAGPAAAPAQSLFEACKTDLTDFCKDVTPGHGRISACLYSHEDKLSESCDAAMVDVFDMTDNFYELVRFATQECRADIEKHCAGTKMGGGRIYSCLKKQEKDLEPACAEAMKTVELPKAE